MALLDDLARQYADLSPAQVERLQRLVADWQILADLSFADLVLWLAERDGPGWRAAAQMRPTTGPTAYVDDIVGDHVSAAERIVLDDARARGRVVRVEAPERRGEVPVRLEAIPVVAEDEVLAVLTRTTNLHGVRTPSLLELTYLQTAGELVEMVAGGAFPHAGQRADLADSPRVGDGFVRVDPRGRVVYASPNALSVYRKLGLTGDLTGQVLADLTRELVPASRRADEETVSAVLGARAARDTELANDSASLVLRSIPLQARGEPVAGLVLLRDVTDIRSRDRELVTKDATIREIHHRVKNNLQTVAALLRLQARRLPAAESRAALEEAVRRVGSIAVVHETLSRSEGESVDFDDVADRLRQAVGELGGATVRSARVGSFGTLDPEVATPLSMALTELMQNAVEHGFGRGGTGSLELVVRRAPDRLHVEVRDDGAGLPAEPRGQAESLGLSIVTTLVDELGGTVELSRRADAPGTVAVVEVPLGAPSGAGDPAP